MHDLVQAVILRTIPGAAVEVRWDVGEVSGRSDGIYQLGTAKTIVEIKTMSAYMFARCLKSGSPQPEHFAQANLTALVEDASLIHIIYIAKGARASEEVFAEWILPADHAAAQLELDRLKRITTQAREGVIADRFYQGDTIDNPEAKRWPCGFCSYKSTCLKLGEGGQPLTLQLKGEAA